VSTVRLRPATSDDVSAIVALLEANRLPAVELEDHLRHFVVAEADGRVVACGGLEAYGRSGLVRSIAVDNAWQGRGLGDQVTRWVLERAAALGIERLLLFTMTAPDFFARFGFTDVTLDAFPVEARRSAQYGAVQRFGDQWGVRAMGRDV
jgi:amino-acid N-acetyltransferase